MMRKISRRDFLRGSAAGMLGVAVTGLAGPMALNVAAEETAEGGSLVIDYFNTPDNNGRPMARMWFPDAGAGEDDDDVIEYQIQQLVTAGFGGVEVAMLADGVSYTNEEGRVYGWGTENWRKLLKKVLKAANGIEGGFQVDITITAHWPPALNTIDPNDDAASKELSYSVTKLTANEDGVMDILLPEQKIEPTASGFSSSKAYPGFLFVDNFIASAMVQVSDIEVETAEDGTESSTYVFDYSTLTALTDAVSVKEGGGYAAGIPDEETAALYGWDYEELCEAFGPEPDGELVNNNGKADEDYDRARMADWQDEYVLDLSGIEVPASSDGDEIQAGDWVVLTSFYRGTGQSITGGAIMHNRVFITSYYNEEGTAEVIGFWNKMFEEDPELLELMKENPAYIFEDSIESSSSTSYWAAGLQDNATNHEYGDIMSIIAASRYTGSGFGGTTLTEFYKFDNDDGMADRIYEEYNNLLAETYVKYRVTGVTKWAKETMGWGFRGQTYQLPGLEIAAAASVVDVPECDNMSKGDGVRYQAGTKNVTGRDYLTMEAITGPTTEYVTLDDVLTELGQNYSDGVTRAILHGTPYSKTFNDYNHEWPGWIAFGYGSFGSAYTYRAAYWDDMDVATGFMTRVETVLQKGTAQIDLAVLIDKESTFDFESGNRFQALLGDGYSYNLISESILQSENAYVENGRLAPEGPAFKALILDRISTFDVESMEKVLEYAGEGLAIIAYSCDINKVYGANVESDETLVEMYEELLAMDNVTVADSEEEVEAALIELGVAGYAQYDAVQLETTMYTDKADGSNYYYMFNNAYPENTGMMGNDQASYYKGEDKVLSNVEVTLEGSGLPYRLDPYTGEVALVDKYTLNDDGTVTFKIASLFGGEAVIYCVSEDAEAFATDAVCYTDISVDESLEAIDLTDATWNLVIHSYGPGGDDNDPSISLITDIDFGEQNLGKWKDIAATEEQLAEIGVPDMMYVSGVGEYSISFILPEGWSAETGAYLNVTYGKDQVGTVTINDTVIDANNVTDRTDLRGYLVEGENTLTIKMSSTLYGRMYYENSGYADAEFGMSSGFMGEADPDAYYNGLLSAVITPYVIG